MIIHPRTLIEQPGYPIHGPLMNYAAVDTVVIHYTADDELPDGDPGELIEDVAPYLQAINRMYWHKTPTGYAIGYNFASDWLGGIWELRGLNYKCAANKDHNEHTVAVLMLTDGTEPPTEPARAAVRELIALVESTVGRQVTILGHDELRDPHHPTGCPGAGNLEVLHTPATVQGGQFSPRYTTTPEPEPEPEPVPPTPTPPPKEVDMQPFIIENRGTGEIALVYGDHPVVGLAGADVAEYEERFGDALPTDPVVWQQFIAKADGP